MNNLPTNTLVPSPHEFAVYQTIAKNASATPYWTKLGGESGILSIMLMAREIDIPPMLAISGGFNNINGKLEVSARLMNMLIRRRGHEIRIKTCNNFECTIWGKRSDTGEEGEATYTIEDAKRANLIRQGGGWDKNPEDMCFARAISRLGRRLFADCIGPFYIEGELQETIEKKAVPANIPADVKEECAPLAIEFVPPEGVSDAMAQEYLEESAKGKSYSIEELKRRAMANPEAFKVSFNKWSEKKMKEHDIEETEMDLNPSVFSEEESHEHPIN